MDENQLKAIAMQLRKPQGEHAPMVGHKMNESNRRMNLETIAHTSAKPTETVLEIGMGNGFFVPDVLALAEGVTYIGCDYSPEMVTEANKLNQQYMATGQAEFHVANATNLPLPGSTVNHILTVNTIYFWEDVAAVLAELRRVLKPNGKLVIAIRPKNVMEMYPFTKHGFTTYEATDVAAVLADNGFIDIAWHEFAETQTNTEASMGPDVFTIVTATMV